MTKPFLSGPTVGLYGLTRDDLQIYRSWIENPEATHFMESGWRPQSDAEMEAIYKASTEPTDTAVFKIIPHGSDKPIGVVGLYLIQWICRRGEFRVLIGDDRARGKGYGTEAARLLVDYAFDKVNLETLYLGVNTENTGAVRSYEKAGFQREGIRRKLVYRNSRYYDVVMMSIIREEWLAARAAGAKTVAGKAK